MKLFLLGGFLGSGKTTAIQQACEVLLNRGIRAGVITNDQGMQLVDSAFMKGHQIPGREVVKGCFCCNYEQLAEGIRSLQAVEKPDLLFAESVGSCADIVATVIRPLLRFHPDLEIVYTVFADATHLLKTAVGSPIFPDDDVNYIYEKQLEEADILIVNKKDLLSGDQIMMLEELTGRHFGDKTILFQNSLQQSDIDRWLKLQETFHIGVRKSPGIDYDKYAAGEAKLAWLDGEAEIFSENSNALEIATVLINNIYKHIRQLGLPVGHLKFLMQAGEWQKKISFTSLNEPYLKQSASLRHRDRISLMINARVQTRPAILEAILGEAFNEIMQKQPCIITPVNISVFQPGYPKPTYRITNA